MDSRQIQATPPEIHFFRGPTKNTMDLKKILHQKYNGPLSLFGKTPIIQPNKGDRSHSNTSQPNKGNRSHSNTSNAGGWGKDPLGIEHTTLDHSLVVGRFFLLTHGHCS